MSFARQNVGLEFVLKFYILFKVFLLKRAHLSLLYCLTFISLNFSRNVSFKLQCDQICPNKCNSQVTWFEIFDDAMTKMLSHVTIKYNINYVNSIISCNINKLMLQETMMIFLILSLTTSKYFHGWNLANRKNEYLICVAHVPREVWSRGLESFTLTR